MIDHADDPQTPLQPNDGNLGFLRNGADLAVLFVVEEDDDSPGDLADYVTFFSGRKGGTASARMHLVPQGPPSLRTNGQRIDQAVIATGGTIHDYAAYGPTPAFSQAIVDSLLPGSRGCYPLRHVPVEAGGTPDLTVRVDGFPEAQGGGAYPWRFDASMNAVCFTTTAPPLGATIEIAYAQACDP